MCENISVLEIIKKRRSIRAFMDKPIPEEILEQLIEALIWAPSAGNLQSRKFFFIYNQQIKEKLVQAAWGQDFIAQAPLVIVGCADHNIKTRYGSRGVELYAPQDVAASVQNLLLVACELGLGTVWVGAFDEKTVSKILKLPNSLRPVTIVPVGYPAETPSAPPRMSKTEAISIIR